jgi:hypothetical protein
MAQGSKAGQAHDSQGGEADGADRQGLGGLATVLVDYTHTHPLIKQPDIVSQFLNFLGGNYEE